MVPGTRHPIKSERNKLEDWEDTSAEQLKQCGVHQVLISLTHGSRTTHVREETLIKLVWDSPIPHLRVQLLSMIATEYY